MYTFWDTQYDLKNIDSIKILHVIQIFFYLLNYMVELHGKCFFSVYDTKIFIFSNKRALKIRRIAANRFLISLLVPEQ